MKMAGKYNVLCLSFWTPPVTRPQAILIGKMIPEWINQNQRPLIVTYDAGEKWDIGLPIHKIPRFRINRFVGRIFVLHHFLKNRYYKKILDIVKDIVTENKIDLVFSFSNPQESNILGALLKESTDIKFISHFSDPWLDNPYKSYHGYNKRKVAEMEKKVIESSDQVIFVNEQLKKLVMKKYPSKWIEKSHVVPHCFNPKDYPAVDKEDKSKFVFSHVGAFYKQRNPKLLFGAFRKLVERNPAITDKVKLNFIGAANDYSGYNVGDLERMVSHCNLEKIVKIVPSVDYKESLRYMKLSDCLIAIDADIPNSPFLPSKVIDYSGSGKSLLGITPQESPTTKFVDNLGYKSFNYSQVDELSNYIEELILNKVVFDPNLDFLKKFEVKNTTSELLKKFSQVLEEK